MMATSRGRYPVFEQQRKFRKQHRREVGAPFLHRFADVVADEQRIHPQMPFHFRVHIIGGADRQRLADLHVFRDSERIPPKPRELSGAPIRYR